VALTTIHLPLVAVPAAVTQEAIGNAIALADQACRLLRLPRRRIGVCGLNPHAGEEGMIGREEIEIIAPAIRTALGMGLDVGGPIPADTLFHRARFGDFDAVVAQYHDQGHIAAKITDFWGGVNITLGLPIIRTSVDHGTAFDIVGTGKANPDSLINAINYARLLAKNRVIPCR
jgi:4-hydroxythreonine-4-phosphate dehydrogenase